MLVLIVSFKWWVYNVFQLRSCNRTQIFQSTKVATFLKYLSKISGQIVHTGSFVIKTLKKSKLWSKPRCNHCWHLLQMKQFFITIVPFL